MIDPKYCIYCGTKANVDHVANRQMLNLQGQRLVRGYSVECPGCDSTYEMVVGDV